MLEKYSTQFLKAQQLSQKQSSNQKILKIFKWMLLIFGKELSNVLILLWINWSRKEVN